MSLRKILISLGVLIAALPYLGLPSWIDTTLYTLSGLTIVFLLTIWKRGGREHKVTEEKSEIVPRKKGEPRALHVKRREVENYPEMHVEKETTFGKLSASTLDTEHIEESLDEDAIVEKKITVTHTKKRKISDDTSPDSEL